MVQHATEENARLTHNNSGKLSETSSRTLRKLSLKRAEERNGAPKAQMAAVIRLAERYDFFSRWTKTHFLNGHPSVIMTEIIIPRQRDHSKVDYPIGAKPF